MLKSQSLELFKPLLESLVGKRIFLTGGTGFFGKSLIDFFLSLIGPEDTTLQLTILSRDSKAFLNQWPKYKNVHWLNFIDGDIENFIFPNQPYNHVLHFATSASAAMNLNNPILLANTILRGSLRVFEFASFCKAEKVLFASSGAVYGRQPPQLSHLPENYEGGPILYASESAYGESKRMAELYGCEYSKKFGFEFKIARCFSFVGPHLDRTGTYAIGNFIRDALSGNEICISGDGTTLRSYLSSDDLIIWLTKILLDGQNRVPYNVGSDLEISILSLAHRVADLIHPQLKISVAKAKVIGALPERYVPNIERARTELNLKPWTSLDDAIVKAAGVNGSPNE